MPVNLEPKPLTKSKYQKSRYILICAIILAITYQVLMFCFAEHLVIAAAQRAFQRQNLTLTDQQVCLIVLITSTLINWVAILSTILEWRFCLILYALMVTVGCLLSIPNVIRGPPIIVIDLLIGIAVAYLSFDFASQIKRKRSGEIISE